MNKYDFILIILDMFVCLFSFFVDVDVVLFSLLVCTFANYKNFGNKMGNYFVLLRLVFSIFLNSFAKL